jgi:Reverse transcriptase (RNA-dependent DNA polymerase)
MRRWMLNKISDKFDIRQFGALKGPSTTHALIDITHTWHQALDNRSSVRTLFIDFSKAFDHVDHATEFRKMKCPGVQPFLLRWMHSFLYERKQRVKIGDGFSSWTKLNGGMPQGTWLGPMSS